MSARTLNRRRELTISRVPLHDLEVLAAASLRPPRPAPARPAAVPVVVAPVLVDPEPDTDLLIWAAVVAELGDPDTTAAADAADAELRRDFVWPAGRVVAMPVIRPVAPAGVEACGWCSWPLARHSEQGAARCADRAAARPGWRGCACCGQTLDPLHSCVVDLLVPGAPPVELHVVEHVPGQWIYALVDDDIAPVADRAGELVGVG